MIPKYILIVLFLVSTNVFGNEKTKGIPEDGEYIYQVRFAEWDNAYHSQDVKVIINVDSIKVYLYKGELTGLEVGDLFEEGLLRFHKQSGNWIIISDEQELELNDVGGCTGGPTVVDFENKIYEIC